LFPCPRGSFPLGPPLLSAYLRMLVPRSLLQSLSSKFGPRSFLRSVAGFTFSLRLSLSPPSTTCHPPFSPFFCMCSLFFFPPRNRRRGPKTPVLSRFLTRPYLFCPWPLLILTHPTKGLHKHTHFLPTSPFESPVSFCHFFFPGRAVSPFFLRPSAQVSSSHSLLCPAPFSPFVLFFLPARNCCLFLFPLPVVHESTHSPPPPPPVPPPRVPSPFLSGFFS